MRARFSRRREPLFKPGERGFDGVAKRVDVVEFMTQQKRKPGQKQRFTLRSGRVDANRERFVSGFDIFE